jgi:hypothetical protein
MHHLTAAKLVRQHCRLRAAASVNQVRGGDQSEEDCDEVASYFARCRLILEAGVYQLDSWSAGSAINSKSYHDKESMDQPLTEKKLLGSITETFATEINS